MQNKYEVIGIVGEGAYGIVYKCKNKDIKEFVAIKKFKETEDDIVKKTMKRELRMLQILKHENVVEFKDAFKRKGNLFLVFEYVERNLLELLQESPKGLDQNLIKKLIFQMCKATKYLHDHSIVHRDIKPENLLVDNNHKLKLCDFGFARSLKNTSKEVLTDYVATRWYRSPELLITNGIYGPEVDYWAIGCIMGELTDGDPLFPGKNEIDQINLIIQTLGNLPSEQNEMFYKNPHYQGSRIIEVSKPETLERKYGNKLSKTAMSFLKATLELNPKDRIKDSAILLHPYFEGLNQDIIQQEAQLKPEKKLSEQIVQDKASSTKQQPIVSVVQISQGNQESSNQNELIQTSINFKFKESTSQVNQDININHIDNNFKTFYKKKDDIYNFELDMNNIKNNQGQKEEEVKIKSKEKTQINVKNQTQNITSKAQVGITKKTSDTGGYFSEQSPNHIQNNQMYGKYNKKNYEMKFKPIQEETYLSNKGNDYNYKSNSPANKYSNYNNVNYKGTQYKYSQAAVYLPNIKQKKMK